MKKSGRILIIDDEINLRQTMARILQREGYEVATAATGADGLTILKDGNFDLVYLDIRMPEMDGLTVLKTIHGRHPHVAVILFTAQPDIHTTIQALRLGASDYLIKPLKPAQVIEHTKAILAKLEIERRRREILLSIQNLQAELASLDEKKEISQAPHPVEPVESNRYVTRGKITLDLHRIQVVINTRVINLPFTAFNYLLVLVRHAPTVVDYQTLVAEAQGYQADLREAQELTKWHIHQIRQAIEENVRRPEFVINVRGTGYRLVSD